jgi:hypothetical protein
LALTCGIDWSEHHHSIALADQTGKLVAKMRVTDDLAGWNQLLALLADHRDTPNAPIPVAIETSRGLLVSCLRATGRPVYAINPMAVAPLPRTLHRRPIQVRPRRCHRVGQHPAHRRRPSPTPTRRQRPGPSHRGPGPRPTRRRVEPPEAVQPARSLLRELLPRRHHRLPRQKHRPDQPRGPHHPHSRPHTPRRSPTHPHPSCARC